jgi:hypothetical protein
MTAAAAFLSFRFLRWLRRFVVWTHLSSFDSTIFGAFRLSFLASGGGML